MASDFGEKIKRGMYWTFGERIGTKIVQFILQLILARILVPDDYGLCALLLAFVNIASIFVNSGFGVALVQKKDADERDFSSVFYLSVSIAFFIYIVLFFSAPAISGFYNDARIISLLRVISISLIIGAYNSVQMSVLQRRMDFRHLFFANLAGIITSAVVSIALALKGFGVWAIVLQYLINRVVVTVVLSYLIKWHPKLLFSWKRVKSLFSFGWKCMASSFLSTVVTDVYITVVGKFFMKSELGVYDTGNKIPSTVSETFSSSLGSVLFTSFSQMQDDKNIVRQYVAKSNRVSSFIMFPLMFGLAVCAEPLIRLLLTDKWIAAVPFMQMACVLYSSYPLHIANINAINALGRSDIALSNELKKKAIDIAFLVIMVHFGLLWVAFGRMMTSIISLWINMQPNKKFLDYSTYQQLKDIAPSFTISLVMCLVMVIIELATSLVPLLLLTIQLAVALVIYFGLSYLFNKDLMRIVFRLLPIINVAKHAN